MSVVQRLGRRFAASEPLRLILQMCQLTSSCEYFTYYPSDGTCLLYSTCEFEATSDALTSEEGCPRPPEKHCFEEGRCDAEEFEALVQDSATECLEVCQGVQL